MKTSKIRPKKGIRTYNVIVLRNAATDCEVDIVKSFPYTKKGFADSEAEFIRIIKTTEEVTDMELEDALDEGKFVSNSVYDDGDEYSKE